VSGYHLDKKEYQEIEEGRANVILIGCNAKNRKIS
jgi:hypothetical protein